MVMPMPVWPLTRRRLARNLDRDQIDRAIKQAEAKTSGEIRVSIAGFFRGEARALAERAFRRLGMDHTRNRNGVLILVAPTRRQVVILGDQGIDAHVGAATWSECANELARHFAHGDFTAGLVATIDRIGQMLAAHFPPEAGPNVNELSDAIEIR
jgi:uncharacterized membrane protein